MTHKTAMFNVIQKYCVVGMLVYTYNISTQDAEAEGLHDFKANLG